MLYKKYGYNIKYSHPLKYRLDQWNSIQHRLVKLDYLIFNFLYLIVLIKFDRIVIYSEKIITVVSGFDLLILTGDDMKYI